jgi:hypothetical protein
MTDRLILVGDNPFHGVSHLSQERSSLRSKDVLNAKYASELVVTSVKNGANGFTFTVSDTTLTILEEIGKSSLSGKLQLYPLIPNVNNLVRTAGATGGLPGLAREMASRMATVIDLQLLGNGVGGIVCNNPKMLLKAYLKYEYIGLRKAIKKAANLRLASLILHEIVTDMALALDMQWVFRAHIELMQKLKLKPGFETRNLPYLVKRFQEWQIGFDGMVIEAPFNAAGFQMCPTQADCEDAVKGVNGSELIAFSILAAGYLKLPEALDYIRGLSGVSGVAIGVSSGKQAAETFPLAKNILTGGNGSD